jgi:hypothetical protein
MQFGREVQEGIHAAIDDRIDDISAALQLDKAELSAGLTDYVRPARLGQSWDGSDASLGLKYPSGDWEARWGIYFYFWIGDGGAQARASCWFREAGIAMGKLASFASDGLEISKTEAWMSEPIGEAAEGFNDAVGRVLGRWVDLWRKVGGIQQFLPPPKLTTAGE